MKPEYWVTITATVKTKIRVGAESEIAADGKARLVFRGMVGEMTTADNKPVEVVDMNAGPIGRIIFV